MSQCNAGCRECTIPPFSSLLETAAGRIPTMTFTSYTPPTVATLAMLFATAQSSPMTTSPQDFITRRSDGDGDLPKAGLITLVVLGVAFGLAFIVWIVSCCRDRRKTARAKISAV